MNGIKWIFKGIILSILSGIFSWLISDGLNWALTRLGMSGFTVNPLTRILSFLSIFLFMTGIDLVIYTRSEINNFKQEINKSIYSALITNVGLALDNALLKVIWPGLDINPKNLLGILGITRGLIYPLTQVAPRLLDAYSVVVERDIRIYAENISKLGSDGFSVDIADHIETSKRLARDASTYTQIQRKAFLVPDEWTTEWCLFLDWLFHRPISCKYIILTDKDTLKREKIKLDSMNKYLTQRGLKFLYCNIESVRDSLGGGLPTEDVIDVFDNDIVKIQGLPKGIYQGGIKLNMRFLQLSQNDSFRRFLQTVSNFAEEYSP